MSKKKPGPKPSPLGRRTAAISLKCREPYKEWVLALARARRCTASLLIDQSLLEFARAYGLPPPPER